MKKSYFLLLFHVGSLTLGDFELLLADPSQPIWMTGGLSSPRSLRLQRQFEILSVEESALTHTLHLKSQVLTVACDALFPPCLWLACCGCRLALWFTLSYSLPCPLSMPNVALECWLPLGALETWLLCPGQRLTVESSGRASDLSLAPSCPQEGFPGLCLGKASTTSTVSWVSPVTGLDFPVTGFNVFFYSQTYSMGIMRIGVYS